MKMLLALSLFVSLNVWAAGAGVPAVPPPAMTKPTVAVPVPPTPNNASAPMVNINTASEADLQKLPGIGPEKAKAIVAARPFGTIDDLKKVKGIKEAVLAKIKPYVTVK